jgi:hypothetical protein
LTPAKNSKIFLTQRRVDCIRRPKDSDAVAENWKEVVEDSQRAGGESHGAHDKKSIQNYHFETEKIISAYKI